MAQGCAYLYAKPKQAEKGQKERKAERVTNPEIIRQFLDGELDNDEMDYYYITTEKPDTLTIRGMLDRTFDKPGQRLAVTDADGNSLSVPATVMFVIRQQKGSDNNS